MHLCFLSDLVDSMSNFAPVSFCWWHCRHPNRPPAKKLSSLSLISSCLPSQRIHPSAATVQTQHCLQMFTGLWNSLLSSRIKFYSVTLIPLSFSPVSDNVDWFPCLADTNGINLTPISSYVCSIHAINFTDTSFASHINTSLILIGTNCNYFSILQSAES